MPYLPRSSLLVFSVVLLSWNAPLLAVVWSLVHRFITVSLLLSRWVLKALRAATERGVDRAKGMAEGERVPFFACGLSSVMHPKVSCRVTYGILCIYHDPSPQRFRVWSVVNLRELWCVRISGSITAGSRI